MKPPIIKQLTSFIEKRDEDYINEALEVLESLTEVTSLNNSELDVIGELISNMYGALEVQKEIKNGIPKTEALDSLLKQVMGSQIE